MYPAHQRALKSFALLWFAADPLTTAAVSFIALCLLWSSGHLAIRSGRKSKFICDAESGRVPTTVACHSPAWLLTDFPGTSGFWLLNLMAEVKNLIKLWIEESCTSTGSLAEQVSSLIVSKGGYFNWFNTPWLWMLLPLWYGILFFPCFACGDQNKIQMLPVSLGNGRYISKQGASCRAWAGDFRHIFSEIRAQSGLQGPWFSEWAEGLFAFWTSSSCSLQGTLLYCWPLTSSGNEDIVWFIYLCFHWTQEQMGKKSLWAGKTQAMHQPCPNSLPDSFWFVFYNSL